jgi:NADH:ubiquinone oxidoreductase subunit 6 (subunit J)
VSILAEQHTLGPVEPLMFYALALLTVLGAWAVMLSQNIVRMAVYLLATLGGVAGFYFMLNAEFLAAVQLIVYAGGTLILIIFGVMLTSKNPFMQLRVQGWEKAVAVALAVVISGLLVLAWLRTELADAIALDAQGYDQVRTIGFSLLGDYLVPFEIAAVLLLIVMIGAAYMARRRSPEQEI